MREAILKELKKMPVIDSHEHLVHERDMRSQKTDVIDFMTPYVCDNLMASGFGEDKWRIVNDKGLPFSQRHALLIEHIESIRFTTYFQSMMKGLNLAYGMQDFGLRECERVNRRLEEGIDTAGLFEKYHIRKALTFIGYYGVEYFNDSRTMIPVPTVSYITPKSIEDALELEKVTGIAVQNLDSLENAIENLFNTYRQCGLKNLKIGSAYNRTLDYMPPNLDKAEMQLHNVLNRKFVAQSLYGQINKNVPLAELKDLDNFVIWKCADMAAKFGMNLIFHTGIHAWNKNDPESCHAKYLYKFIEAHPDQKIILLHLGYPFTSESLLLSRYYPNVYLDFAWLHTLDRRAAIDTIKRVVELLPSNKIAGFGGDVCTPVNTIGNLSVCLENMACAFSDMAENGEMTCSEAVNICRNWLFENPKKIYGVNIEC